MKEIVVDISDDGEVHIETRGFQGKACIEESEFLKKLLGKEAYRRLTPSYYVTQTLNKKKYLQLCG